MLSARALLLLPLVVSVAAISVLALTLAFPSRPTGATTSAPCSDTPITQWPASAGGNDHFYQGVCAPARITWDAAKVAAEAAGGHLVTQTSSAENDFVFGLIDSPGFWDFYNGCSIGPWIGLFQPDGSPEPAGGWSWVTGEAFVFSNWVVGEPNNQGGHENVASFWGESGCPGTGVRTAKWNDGNYDHAPLGGALSYVVEWEENPSPTPEPTETPTASPTPSGTATPTPTPTPTPGPEDRKVIFIQGIDSESGDCGETFRNRVKWMVDYLTTADWVKSAVPLHPDNDFFYFSYSGYYCDQEGINPPGYRMPKYVPIETCDGIMAYAGKLDRMVKDLAFRYPDAKFDIVAHSMGGMVAAYWLKTHTDMRDKVNAVVTFDSPLRGVEHRNWFTSACLETSQSWVDLHCDNYDDVNDCSHIVFDIANVAEAPEPDVAFFTIDATRQDKPLVEAVPRDRTTLLSSDSTLHCQFDDSHGAVWENSATEGTSAIRCWQHMTWPPDSDHPSSWRVDSVDAKAAFVACAITSLAADSCLDKIGPEVHPETVLREPSPAGSSSLDVTDTSSLAVGDHILINPGMPNEEENQVVGFGSILLAWPLEFDHQAGEPVVKVSPPSMVAGWNQPCYLGPEQPIEEALSGIIGDVLAVYRLSASQSFESWFPRRPGVSTITAIRPYEPLFILMAKDAAWSQTPSSTPPTSANLAQGWNSVCYTGSAKAPEDATSGIADELAILYTLGSDQAWGHYVPGRPEASDIAQIDQYAAVLVLVTEPGGTQWVFDP